MVFTLTPVSAQQLTNPDRVAFSIRTSLPAGRDYVIEWSANLVDWMPLQSGTANGSLIEVIEGVVKRFYHLRITN